METNAFARARNFLNYAATAKWTALLASAASGVVYVLLIGMLALFIDLLVSQGQIPTFHQLPIAQQNRFPAAWHALENERRIEALKHLNLTDKEIARIVAADAPTTLSDKSELTFLEQEIRWRAFVWDYLKTHVHEEAASTYQPKLDARGLQIADVFDAQGKPLGILSLVVRSREQLIHPAIDTFAAVFSWSWKPTPRTDGTLSNPNETYLTGLLVLALLLVGVRFGLIYLMNRGAATATLDAINRMRRLIYHQTYRLGMSAVRAAGPTEASSLFTRHCESIHTALYTWLTGSVRYPVTLVLLLVLAFLVNFWLALCALVLAALVWIIGGQIASNFQEKGYFASRRAANRLALLQESLKMMRLVKCYLMESFNQARIERQLGEYSKAHTQRYAGEMIALPLLGLMASVAATALFYLAGKIALREGLSAVNLVILIVALVSLYFPARGWLEMQQPLRRGRDSAAILFEYLGRRGEITQGFDAEFLQPLSKAIEFREVKLREPGSARWVLRDISLTIPAGQKVCLIGEDETELHAIAYLIPRFADPTEGEVRIDGVDIRSVTQDSLRAQIAMVMQNSLIFNDTVANNIGCGDPSFTLPQIIEAAKFAHAHQVIQRLPAGYETPIGELGHSLRPSEQFRIALARAILRDPSILIIEEPDTPFDADTQALWDDTLDRFLPGRTVLFIARRLNTLKDADRIYLIQDGQVVLSGDHNKLLVKSPLYKHLVYMDTSAILEKV